MVTINLLCFVFLFQKLINHLRIHCHSFAYAASMSAPIVEQIYRTTLTIMGLDGTNEG